MVTPRQTFRAAVGRGRWAIFGSSGAISRLAVASLVAIEKEMFVLRGGFGDDPFDVVFVSCVRLRRIRDGFFGGAGGGIQAEIDSGSDAG